MSDTRPISAVPFETARAYLLAAHGAFLAHPLKATSKTARTGHAQGAAFAATMAPDQGGLTPSENAADLLRFAAAISADTLKAHRLPAPEAAPVAAPEFFRLIGRANVFRLQARYMAAEIIPSVRGECAEGTTSARVVDVEFCNADGSPLEPAPSAPEAYRGNGAEIDGAADPMWPVEPGDHGASEGTWTDEARAPSRISAAFASHLASGKASAAWAEMDSAGRWAVWAKGKASHGSASCVGVFPLEADAKAFADSLRHDDAARAAALDAADTFAAAVRFEDLQNQDASEPVYSSEFDLRACVTAAFLAGWKFDNTAAALNEWPWYATGQIAIDSDSSVKRNEEWRLYVQNAAEALAIGLERLDAPAMVPQPVQQQQARHTVSLFVNVTDDAAVIAEGVAELIEQGVGEDEAAAEIGDDVSKALRYILDPGSLRFRGLEILDSACDCDDASPVMVPQQAQQQQGRDMRGAPSFAVVPLAACGSVSDFLRRNLDTACRPQDRAGWQAVADALSALENDTDCIVTDPADIGAAPVMVRQPVQQAQARDMRAASPGPAPEILDVSELLERIQAATGPAVVWTAPDAETPRVPLEPMLRAPVILLAGVAGLLAAFAAFAFAFSA